MTPCTGNPADLYLERYLHGSLSEFEAHEFEEHYFECSVCLAQVQVLGAVAARLASHPAASRSAAISRRVLSWPVRLLGLGAIAALVVFGVLSFRVYHAGRQPSKPQMAAVVPAPASVQMTAARPVASPDLTNLADLSLPPFRVTLLRGPSTASDFADGMAAYARHDCRSAMKYLSQISHQDENKLAAEFYAGVCEMKLGNLDAASVQLQQVATAGDSPQQEASLYYLAQVSLLRKDNTAARQYLVRTVALHGDFTRQARAELHKLD